MIEHITEEPFLGEGVRGNRPKEVEFKLHSEELMGLSSAEDRNWEEKAYIPAELKLCEIADGKRKHSSSA